MGLLMAFEWPLRVYIEDTDFGGIVYYVNYLKFMERARTEILRSAGFSQQTLVNEHLLFVVHNVQCQYHRPARLDDELIVRSSIEQAGAASVTFNQQIVRVSDQVELCVGQVRVACVDARSMKPRRWPVDLLGILRQTD